jgi:hypothetical protein
MPSAVKPQKLAAVDSSVRERRSTSSTRPSHWLRWMRGTFTLAFVAESRPKPLMRTVSPAGTPFTAMPLTVELAGQATKH